MKTGRGIALLRTKMPLFLTSLLALAGAAPARAANCDRACLIDTADKVLASIAHHDPSSGGILQTARITENRVASGTGSIWRTATTIAKTRQYVVDVPAQQIGVQTIAYEGAAPVILALRLKLEDGTATEAELLVTRDGEGGPPFEPEGFLIREAPYIRDVPAAVRSSRQTLLKVARRYWTLATTTHQPDAQMYLPDCFHFQNGVNTDWERQLTPSEAAAPERNAPQTYDGRIWICARELILTTAPWSHERAVNTLVDEERGLVMTWNLVDVAGRPGPDGKIPPPPAAGAPLPDLPGNAPPGLSRKGWALRSQPQTFYNAEVKRIIDGRIQREQVFQRALPANAQ
jgi:hypothetical protein